MSVEEGSSADTGSDGVFETEAFIRTVSEAQVSAHTAVGVGTDIRFVTGGALSLEDRVVHLCAFPTVRDVRRPGIDLTEMVPFSRRRRNRAG